MLQCPKCGRRYGQGETACPEDGTALRADVTVIGFAPDVDPLAGSVLDGKYRLEEWLGEGGMGTVYRATHLLIDRHVAVKVLHPRFVGDESARQRFRREARAAGRLRHPNAVAVTDFGQTPDGYVYIVMELLEGWALREVLSAEAPLPVERAVSLMTQAAAAVEAAHESGVIHRDLKPGNIFVVQRKNLPPVVKVLDFGIAKLAVDNLEESDAKNLTQTGVMIGTPRYMSPEQCDGEKLTPASDVYSLGIIFYEMLTGETPFNGATPLAVALQHSSKQPRPPRELLPSIPEELERVVLHALAKKPTERPADAGAFRRELEATARRLGLTQRPDGYDNTAAGAIPNGDGATPSDCLVFDLEAMRARTTTDVAVRSNETTVLANTAEQRHATDSVVRAQRTAEVITPRRARDFTRLHILLGRRHWLDWAKQPPVLITLSLVALVLVVSAIGYVKTRRADEPASGAAPIASEAATPTPSPATSPSPEPTVEESAAKREQTGRGRRAGDAGGRRQQQQQQRRTSRGNPVVRTLKKIFKNPF